MKTKVTIELLVDGDPSDVQQAVENILDNGELQEAINDYDDAELEVESALVVMCTAFGESNKKCSEGGYCNYVPDLEYDPTGQTINCEKCGEES